jgi:mRNA interferase MazF
MRRAEVRLVDLNPARGAEANKRRPAVIVSNDAANTTATRLGRGVLTVVPVLSNVERVYPFQVLLASGTAGLAQDSKVQAEQVRSIAVERIGELLGTVPDPIMALIDDALRLHLAL